MRLWRVLCANCLVTLGVAGVACVLNPQPQPPDTADGAGSEAGVVYGDGADADAAKGVDGEAGAPADGGDGGDGGLAADAADDAPEGG